MNKLCLNTAVSEEVVLQIAKGPITANADFAVSVSGIAGPGGGSENLLV